MLNSVARYLWGSSSESEPGPETVEGQVKDKQQQDDVAAAEQLATHHDDDWVVVGRAGQDKDRNRDKNSPFGHQHHHLNHPSHLNLNHPHHYNQQHALTSQAEGSSSLSQNSLCGGNLSAGAEAEALDEASSLFQNEGLDGLDGRINLDLDSNYSSDTESSPESVFSACSGRSHATYHPQGASSEPWVIAPPPCFTGSQVGTLSPVAASPLENLLIEHPSMSVYLSVPHSALPASHPYLSTTSPTGDSALGEANHLRQQTNLQEADPNGNHADPNGNHVTSSPAHDVSRLNPPRPPCNRQRNGGMVHHEGASIQEVARMTRAAQQIQSGKAQKVITAQRCERQNKVRDIQSHPKGKNNNRRNKHNNASGAKCSRYSQRV